MARKNFFNKIASVINDSKNTSFIFNQKQYVPGLMIKDVDFKIFGIPDGICKGKKAIPEDDQ